MTEPPSPFSCVLITIGSLNPVHRAHLGNLKLVRDHVERELGYHVLAAYLSPSQYVSFTSSTLIISFSL